MDDDDEFTFDELDPDELSAIEAIESNYYAGTQAPKPASQTLVAKPQSLPPPIFTATTKATTTTTARPSAAKRPRTDAWTADKRLPPALAPAKPNPTRFVPKKPVDFDDPPDISVALDGSYFMTQSKAKEPNTPVLIKAPFRPPQTKPSSTSNAAPRQPETADFKPPLPQNRASGYPSVTRATANGHTAAQLAPPIQPPQRRSPSPAPPNGSQDRKSSWKPSAPAASKVPSINSTTNPQSRQSAILQPSSPGAGPSRPRINSTPDTSGEILLQTTGATDLSETAQLKAQLALLQKQTEDLKASLKNARDATMMKEGEASNIKRLMEKQNQLHAANVEKLKAERDAKVAAALKSQDTLQSTIEGLKTQLVFQKHELDQSANKWAFGSAKKKGVQMSQLPMGTPRRLPAVAFGADAWGRTPQRKTGATPSRPVATQLRVASPTKSKPAARPNVVKKSEASTVEELGFTMFHNTFTKPSSPVKKRDKGKFREPASSPTKLDVEDEVQMQLPSSDGLMPYQSEGMPTPRQPNSSQVEESQPVEPPPDQWRMDPRRELHALLFSHAVSDFNQRPVLEPELTLQILLSTPLPPDAPAATTSSFRHGCALILGAFSSHPRDENWWEIMQDVAKGLVVCVHVLVSHKLVTTLIPILKLLEALLVVFPQFHSEAVTARSDDNASLVGDLARIVREDLSPPPPNLGKASVKSAPEWADTKTNLAKGVLSVMEALAWAASAGNAIQLAKFVSEDNALLMLLNPGQPSWVVGHALRLALILATHKPILQPLLGLGRKGAKDTARLPILQTMSGYLVLPHRWCQEPEIYSMAESIVGFFATLTEVDDDGTTALLESLWVLPSLVMFLMAASVRLFEDDDTLVEGSPEDQLRVVEALHPALHLLWHLVRPWDPVVNLRVKILEAAARDPQQFNGLHHLFIVAFGRLSFADPPDWLPQPGKDALAKMADLARDLLDTVVEGPESDAIWEAYQEGDEESQHGIDADEEELARMQMAMQVDDD